MAEVQQDTLGSAEDTLRFLDMVGLFGTQAMIALGKLANPATGKAQKNLPAARLFIDTLEMLEHKTKGNLNSDETKVLHATLTDLRLMFVEESKTPEQTKNETPKPESPAGAPAKGGASSKADATEPHAEDSAKTGPETSEESKTKFHKKYE
ncbi:MAG TPA: DUF1844 domain-containing protein [Verrucomicrobiae bacterium]|nr:DUF1844 domain-containing protein [Verrucomicrobiae bacterium]